MYIKKNWGAAVFFFRKMLLIALVGSLLLAVVAIAFFPPRWLLKRISATYEGVDFYFDTNGQKAICLTIDDAPSSGTPVLLSVLRELQVKATFFVIGNNAATYPDIVNEILNDGHEICNHDISNRRSATVAETEIQYALRHTHQLLLSHLQQTTSQQQTINWFRPGAGFFNKSILKCCSEMGYRCALGDVYSHDPQLPWASFIAWHMRFRTKPGSVLIIHDGSISRVHVTIKVLKNLIPHLQENGYTFLTLSQMRNSFYSKK